MTLSLGKWFPTFQRRHVSSKHLKPPIQQCSIISQSMLYLRNNSVIIPAIINCINLITDSCTTGSRSPSRGYAVALTTQAHLALKLKKKSKTKPLLPRCPFLADYRVNSTFCHPDTHMELQHRKFSTCFIHLSHFLQLYSMANETMFNIFCAHPIRVIPLTFRRRNFLLNFSTLCI